MPSAIPGTSATGEATRSFSDYCIANDIGLVGILHSDGQYLPEELPRLVREFLAHPRCAMFYGSRLQGAPLAGGMPRYRLVANLVLTWAQNCALSAHYSEYHSGYRFYRLNEIRQLPYHENSDYYHFDSHIMFQIHHSGGTIDETSIPTQLRRRDLLHQPVQVRGGHRRQRVRLRPSALGSQEGETVLSRTSRAVHRGVTGSRFTFSARVLEWTV